MNLEKEIIQHIAANANTLAVTMFYIGRIMQELVSEGGMVIPTECNFTIACNSIDWAAEFMQKHPNATTLSYDEYISLLEVFVALKIDAIGL